MSRAIGEPVRRREDVRFLSGRGRYLDDHLPDHVLHMAFVRSMEAHGRIEAIHAEDALALPGVVGVFAISDFEGLPPLQSAAGFERPVLARDKVHFAGEPVAVVVAEDPYVAADAAAAVFVDVDPLPVVADVEGALADGAPLIFEDRGTNVIHEVPAREDVEADLAAAPHRLSVRMRNPRVSPAPLEPNGCLARWDAEGLTVWAPTQVPHQLKNRLAAAFGLHDQQTRVIAPDIGGAFGVRITDYPEYLLAPELSRRLGKPVKYLETRRESFVHLTHGRDQIEDVEVGFDGDGTLLAMRLTITQNVGGWPDFLQLDLPYVTAILATGCYRLRRLAVGYRCVVTNQTPVSAYRGAGKPEASYLIERIVDLVADATGLDPLEVRRRNFIQPDEFPWPTPGGTVYDTGEYDKALDKLLEAVDYPALLAEQGRRREDAGARLLGIGFSTYVEVSADGPSERCDWNGFGGWESATVRMAPDGTVQVRTGSSPQGQGTETTFAQIAADSLGIAVDRVSVLHSDTATVQEGIGTWGSRAVGVGGAAVRGASERIGEKLRRLAARRLEAHPDDLVLEDGQCAVKGSPAHAVPVPELARTAYRPHDLPPEEEPGLETSYFFEPRGFSFPFGAHCCLVGVDRETGAVQIERYVAVDDCGTVINPLLVEGQVRGGLAQGIGQALFEAIAYDPNGQPLTASFIDYMVPGAPDLPDFETHRTVTPTPINPLGAKGTGEVGTTAAPSAVVNAVVDALSHLGVRHIDMPITPAAVWGALGAARG